MMSLIVLSGSVCAANEVQANPTDEGLSESGRGAPLRHAKLQENGMIRGFSGPVASLMRIINASFTAFTALLYFMDFLFVAVLSLRRKTGV